MKSLILTLIIVLISNFTSMAQNKKRELTDEEKRIILYKGTEVPFSGKYIDYREKGVYVCKQCGNQLYKSTDKFSSHCGWPSFDDEIKGSVKHIPDADGMRTEIVCANCNGHLGHVFLNEGYTAKNTRHCVNSISIEFVPEKDNLEIAIFAGGCFWGVEFYMERQKGVLSVESGYIGGTVENPTYEMVCSQTSNYAEAVKIVFDTSLTNFEELTKLFFEIHDPTQLNRQGPDVGEQYRSEIFYANLEQKAIAEKLIKILQKKGYDIATKVTAATKFYTAEDYHQNYYKRKRTFPYCHKYTKRF